MPPATQSSNRPCSRNNAAMARTLARAWPSNCIRFSSDTPPSVHKSVGSRTSASVLPPKSNARHLTAPVLKSQPVTTLSGVTYLRNAPKVVSHAKVAVLDSALLYHAPPRFSMNARRPSSPGGSKSTIQNAVDGTGLGPNWPSLSFHFFKELSMNARDAIRTALQATHAMLNSYVSDLTDADFLVRPVHNANHIAC